MRWLLVMAMTVGGCDWLRGVWGISDKEAFQVLQAADDCRTGKSISACYYGSVHLVSESQARRWRLIHPAPEPAASAFDDALGPARRAP